MSTTSRIDYEQQYDHPQGETYTERMRVASRLVTHSIIVLILGYIVAMWAGLLPSAAHGHHDAARTTHDPHAADVHADDHGAGHGHGHGQYIPSYWALVPFALLLGAIAVLPLIKATEHWWHHNKNRFLVASSLGIVTLIYYGWLHPGGLNNHFTHAHGSAAGLDTVWTVFCNAIFAEYIPFIVLLFALYVISGGINLRGDLPAHPTTNCAFIGIGTLLASFIGTTGAAMVLIRPLLATNAERKFKVHTVVFFIFMVCNCGGLLLPIGDPPLFLGYLRGVSFTWTLQLWPFWLGLNIALLIVYYAWDSLVYKKESVRDIVRDETEVRPLELTGKLNFLFLLGVVLCVAFVVPDKPFLGTSFVPPQFFREALMLVLVVTSLYCTNPHTRVLNRFDYVAITEVAALFCGIFICMQVPIEILNIKGSALGIDSPGKFFWATGILSSFLDNAPTYVVFFETAAAMPPGSTEEIMVALSTGGQLAERFLIPISLGAVFMGANSYIGNGPNFMVKSIAEQAGVKMPSFFGYMVYSTIVLVPLFIVITFLLPG